MVSIGAILPFLAILSNPNLVFEHTYVQPVIQILGYTDDKELLLLLTIVFIGTAVIAGAVRLLLLWSSTKLSYAIGSDLSMSIYNRTLYQPYSVHVGRNSSEVIDGITNKSNNIIHIINMTLNLISSTFILSAILIALFSLHVKIALASFVGFGIIYISINLLTKRRLFRNSKIISEQSILTIKSLQEGLGGIREILINNNQKRYCDIYNKAEVSLRNAQSSNQFISFGPRYVIEAMGIVIISILAYILAKKGDEIGTAIPILGALALGVQRLLPVLQQAYVSISSIQGGRVSLLETLEFLNQKVPNLVEQNKLKKINFISKIELTNINFSYENNNTQILKNVTLTIQKGSHVGFIGTTGCGKSTLIDIIMGLLQSKTGNLEVDGKIINSENCRSWQANIAHVSQNIYLADSSIEENIAFGIPKKMIDFNQVVYAASQAQISKTIESWPNKYKTFIGERGVRLSGGQRQRIGIARALYKKSNVIIFDEATSALDNNTEESVMDAISKLSNELTLIIVTHRINTLKKCNMIVEIDQGEIKRIIDYNDLIENKD